MLVIGSITCHEPDLRQSILESDAFCGLRVFDVLLEGPVCALGNFGNYQTTNVESALRFRVIALGLELFWTDPETLGTQ